MVSACYCMSNNRLAISELQGNLSYLSTLPHDLAPMGNCNLSIDFSSADVGQLPGILEPFNLISTLIFLHTITVIVSTL